MARHDIEAGKNELFIVHCHQFPTAWKQGFKALGVVRSIDRGEKYNDESTTVVDISYIFPDAVSRTDILRDAPATLVLPSRKVANVIYIPPATFFDFSASNAFRKGGKSFRP